MNDDLHDLLHDAVSDVEPAYSLSAIQLRVRAVDTRRRGRYTAGVASLAAAAVVGGVVLFAAHHRPLREYAAPATPVPSASCTTEAASGSAAFSSSLTLCSAAPAPRGDVPVFYVGHTPDGPRLFSERAVVPGDLDGALAALMRGAADPDYRTGWPAGSLESARVSDGQIEVRFGASSLPSDHLSEQQLVYTLQAVTGTHDPVTCDHLDHACTITPDPQLDVLAMVNVTAPAEGQRVSGSFSATGLASSFEGTVPWQVLDADGKAVVTGFAQSSMAPRLTPWTTRVDVSALAPGSYTFAASTDDPSGGAEGAGPTTDTRTIVVE